MTVHNHAETLARAFDSLAQQTLQDFELIVIDDGSTDRSWDVISAAQRARMRVHRNLKPQGRAASLNLALQWASGEIIAGQGAGDVSAPQRLEKQAALLARRKDAAAVVCGVEWVDRGGRALRSELHPTRHAALVSALRQSDCALPGMMMLRREAVMALGGCRQSLRHAADLDLWLRLADSHKLAAVTSPLVTTTFRASRPCVEQADAYRDFVALACRLADERAAHGAETTDADEAGDAIALRYGQMGLAARQRHRAANLVEWAHRLESWGGSAAELSQALGWEAVRTWPFDRDAWRLALDRGGPPPAADSTS